MSKEEIADDSVTKSTDSECENNQMGYNEEEYITGDDNKEENNECESSSHEEENDEDDDDEEDDEDDDEDDEDEDEDEDGKTLSLKDGSELFVLSVDGIPRFYTKTVDEARDKMWEYARFRRIHETQNNTYIRTYLDKNRIEIVGCNRFSVFFVDRTICWLLVSQVQELETTNVQKNNDTFAPPSTPIVDSPPKKGFFSSFFW